MKPSISPGVKTWASRHGVLVLLLVVAVVYPAIRARLGVGICASVSAALRRSTMAQLAVGLGCVGTLVALSVTRCRHAIAARLHFALPLLLSLCLATNLVLATRGEGVRDLLRIRRDTLYSYPTSGYERTYYLAIYPFIREHFAGRTFVRYSDQVFNAYFLRKIGRVSEVLTEPRAPHITSQDVERFLDGPHVVVAYQERLHRQPYDRLPGRKVEKVVFAMSVLDTYEDEPDRVFHILDGGETYFVVPERLMPGRAGGP